MVTAPAQEGDSVEIGAGDFDGELMAARKRGSRMVASGMAEDQTSINMYSRIQPNRIHREEGHHEDD